MMSLRRVSQLLTLAIAALAVAACDETEECPSNDTMVSLTANDFSLDIDKYEATRLGCSLEGKKPATGVTYARAVKACESAGKRLCTLDEWQRACRSVGLSYAYPYGPTYDGARCNGQEAGRGAVVAAGSFAECATRNGVFDMSGNVREWVEGPNGPVLAGGSFGSGANDLQCTQYIAPVGGADAYEPGNGDGFRCCR